MRKGFILAISITILILLALNIVGLVYLNHERIADKQAQTKVNQTLGEGIQEQIRQMGLQVDINKAQLTTNGELAQIILDICEFLKN